MQISSVTYQRIAPQSPGGAVFLPSRQRTAPTNDRGKTIGSELVGEINVHSATHEELREVGNRLFKAGMIDREIHSMMLIDWNQVVKSLEERGYRDVQGYYTKADAEGRYDWVAECEAQIRAAKHRGDTESARSWEKVLGVLLRLSERTINPIDTQV